MIFRLRNLRRLTTFCRLPVRRLLTALMLLGYLAATIGYPEYRAAVSKESSEPFPCQHSACGCRTAEQCRKNCCCHTKQEKIAWALARGIDPNRVAILTPEESQRYVARKPAVCCQKAKKACCSKKAKAPQTTERSCCQKQTPPAGVSFVVGIHAQKCRGTGVDWIQSGFVALPPAPVILALAPPAAPGVSVALPSYLSPTLGKLVRPG